MNPLNWRPRNWSRETRDTLFMLTVIAATVAPHLSRVPPVSAALCVLVLLWRVVLALQQAPLPSRWTLLGVLLVAVVSTWASQRTLLGKEAGVTLLVMLMALKTLELRARRDALVVFFLGFFLVLTQFLFSQSLLTALGTVLAVWGWLTALTLAHMPAGRPRLREAASLAARAALWGTPLMVALFLLFPRLGPLWGNPEDSARTGLSDQLRLGDVADLAIDDSVALRVRFKDRTPTPEQLYFRGPVLTIADEDHWSAEPYLPGGGLTERLAPRPPEGAPIRYEMTLEPTRAAWLPLLEHTVKAPQTTPAMEGWPQMSDGSGQWRLKSPLAERVKLEALAWMDRPSEPQMLLTEYRRLIQLPQGMHPRTRAWAVALRQMPEMKQADATALANEVMRHIRAGGYSYTLQPGENSGDPVDHFWLDSKSGFCEHYATAFVVIMRAMNIPARIVTGYQGADPDLVDGYTVVRQSNAHAWAEYWLFGQGWARADPTAAVSPDRIHYGRQLRPKPGLIAQAFDVVTPGFALRLRQWVEAIDNRWNQWVMGYGRQQQYRLMDSWGLDALDRLATTRVLVALISTLALAGVAWAAWDSRRRNPWQKLQAGIHRELARLGLESHPHETAQALARRVRLEFGDQGQPVVAWLLELDAARYGPSQGTPKHQPERRLRAWLSRLHMAVNQTLSAHPTSPPSI